MGFIVLVGVVSLFADMTYEGARSATAPFLQSLGATAAVVGLVAGLGELLGYGLRMASGYLSDRTRQYWLITGIGYAVNLLAVPLLALAGNWPLAAALMILERVGKGVRTPARDAMLSHATSQVGHGFGFGLHEALDQIGAVTGPLIVAAIVYAHGSYRAGFAALAVPAVLALATLLWARVTFPDPQAMEAGTPPGSASASVRAGRGVWREFGRRFWLYMAFASLTVFGFVHFQIIAFHWKAAGVLADAAIPLAFSVAMAVDALAALLAGRAFDRRGLSVLAVMPLGSLAAAVLVFASSLFAPAGASWPAWAAIVIWGVAMGVQESTMRAAIPGMVKQEVRATAYGVFNLAYGLAWFAGSAVTGFLYDVSPAAVVALVLLAQIASLPVLAAILRPAARPRGASA
ncbi:MAG: MFS transporter [Firmicutes bacterium]|nr:MFS transporter [Bacillota bacterium]